VDHQRLVRQRADVVPRALTIASTQRWRGAGNMAAKDSWKPGRMLAW
jgi:hypothetical protein